MSARRAVPRHPGPGAARRTLLVVLLAAGAALAAPAARTVPVEVAPFASPAELQALGPEVARALEAELGDQRVEARPGEAQVAVQGRVESEGGDRVRLSATLRGQTVEVSGDLERVDDLVRTLAGRLRPLLDGADRPGRSERADRTDRPAADRDKDKGRRDVPPRKAPETPEPKPQPTPEPPQPPPKEAKDVPTEPQEVHEVRPDLAPPPEPPPEEEPRVAVHVVGEPVGATPAGLYGMGLAAQQALVTHLTRHHVRAVASRAVGLVPGREALAASLRLGARYTLMARFEALGLTSAPGDFGTLALTGRLHVVLLHEGRLRFDRSYTLPLTPFGHGEPPSTVGLRAVGPLLDTIAADVAAKLH